ncbi:IS110 family transposase [Actinacidiphila glaucinigra]|uniref:IS110 family transposase n=1 Tax=Actinacidiphila glaucinigra TaxID=235986 RepID=UPI003D8CFF1F
MAKHTMRRVSRHVVRLAEQPRAGRTELPDRGRRALLGGRPLCDVTARKGDGMYLVHERCAGIDIGKVDCKVCIRIPGRHGRRHTEIRTFSTMTEGLLALREWLVSEGITLVGMEATGSYWKPVYYIPEEQMETWLLNAQHMRNVPGRKTDVRDCQWICQLLEHGLVRPSFVPLKPIRQLRDLTRYRTEVTRAPGRSNAWRNCWKTPGSNCRASSPTSAANRRAPWSRR